MIILKALWADANIIVIDKLNRTISFTNFITRRERSFSFDSFSGYMKSGQRTLYGVDNLIYLVGDTKHYKKLFAAIYNNLDEMRNAFYAIKYLGFRKLSFLQKLAVFFNRQVPGSPGAI